MRMLGKKGIDESDLKVKSANIKMTQKKNPNTEVFLCLKRCRMNLFR